MDFRLLGLYLLTKCEGKRLLEGSKGHSAKVKKLLALSCWLLGKKNLRLEEAG
jgi:hypothetical protein